MTTQLLKVNTFKFFEHSDAIHTLFLLCNKGQRWQKDEKKDHMPLPVWSLF